MDRSPTSSLRFSIRSRFPVAQTLGQKESSKCTGGQKKGDRNAEERKKGAEGKGALSVAVRKPKYSMTRDEGKVGWICTYVYAKPYLGAVYKPATVVI